MPTTQPAQPARPGVLHRALANGLVKMARRSSAGTPIRHARGVVVSSTIGTSVVTLDGGATQVVAYNPSHAQKLVAGTVVDVLVVGTLLYILAAYGANTMARHPYRAEMYRNAAYTQAAAGGVIIPYDTIPTGGDPSGSCTTGAAAKFTCPIPGIYLAGVGVFFTPTSGQRALIEVMQNGAAAKEVQGTIPNGVAAIGMSGFAQCNCAAGDTLQGRFNPAATNTVFTVGQTFTWFTVCLLAAT